MSNIVFTLLLLVGAGIAVAGRAGYMIAGSGRVGDTAAAHRCGAVFFAGLALAAVATVGLAT